MSNSICCTGPLIATLPLKLFMIIVILKERLLPSFKQIIIKGFSEHSQILNGNAVVLKRLIKIELSYSHSKVMACKNYHLKLIREVERYMTLRKMDQYLAVVMTSKSQTIATTTMAVNQT